MTASPLEVGAADCNNSTELDHLENQEQATLRLEGLSTKATPVTAVDNATRDLTETIPSPTSYPGAQPQPPTVSPTHSLAPRSLDSHLDPVIEIPSRTSLLSLPVEILHDIAVSLRSD